MIKLRIKKVSFNILKLMDKADRAEQRVLFRAGSFMRTTMRRSIRKRRRISEPGQPPSSPTTLLRNSIRFGVEKRSVFVGPIRLAKNVEQDRLPATALEFGGNVIGTIVTRQVGKKKAKKRVVKHYRPRPYVGPALEKTTPEFPKLFSGSIVGP